MFEFDAHFYETKIFIGGKKEYTLGEILKKYLSKNIKGLDDIHHKCKRYVGHLHYPESQEEANSCDELFQGAMIFYTRVDGIISSFPPYNAMKLKTSRLYDLLNEYNWIFDNEPNLNEWDSYERRNPEYNDHFYTSIPLDKVDTADTMDEILKFNAELKAFATEYLTFIEDLIRIKNVYEPFLELLHSQSKYLDNNETAKVYVDFMEQTNGKLYPYEKLKPSGTITISHTVLKQNESSVLCESYHFSTIGAFLYIELFKGMEQHYLPKKCGYCGKHFLLEGGIFSDYCTRPVKDKEGKVCRDVGHRKKYADKVKNDPIWLTYSRAYKAHYARYMKKKMTQTEFQKWADFALNIREKALNEEFSFDEYCEKIKK